MRPSQTFFSQILIFKEPRQCFAWAWVLLLVLLFSVFSLLFVQSYREWAVFRSKEERSLSKIALLEKEIRTQEEYLDAILRDPLFVEHVARERLGYARKGELLFRFRH